VAIVGTITRTTGPSPYKANLVDGKFLGMFVGVREALQPFLDTYPNRAHATRQDLPGNVEHYIVEST
jgi:hypothetical protein